MDLQGLSVCPLPGSLPDGESPHGGGGFVHIRALPFNTRVKVLKKKHRRRYE